jgi:hypothetical protein
MKIDLNKKLFMRGCCGQDKVFLIFPRYIEGYIIWLDYVWKHYSYEYDRDLILPRVRKKYYEYSRII